MIHQAASAESDDAAYRGLYRLGGAAALVVAALTLGEVVAFALHPQPATVDEWFALFQSNAIVGLLDYWVLELPMYASFTLVFLALYAVLGKAGRGRMAIALALALLGIGVFFATNNPFSMLSLSSQHAAATTEAQRSTLLAAGQAVLAMTGQRAVGGFNVGLFLVTVAGLIVSSVMLRGDSFSRWTAYVGLLAHGLAVADYVRQALTSSALVALLVILSGALLLVTWYVLIGRRLYQLGRREAKTTAAQA